MHVLQLVWFYLVLLKIRAQEETCFKSYGYWSENSIIAMEYTPLDISFTRYLKRNCLSGALTIMWLKDNKEIQRKTTKKKNRIVSHLSFYSLSKADSGNYTLFICNKIFNYTFAVSLSVLGSSAQLRTIREFTVPENNSDVVHKRLYWIPKMTEIPGMKIVSSYEDFKLSCMFYSTAPVENVSINWYLQRFKSDNRVIVRDISRITRTHTEIPCYIDRWMSSRRGYCYSAELKFTPFIPTDSGSYTCNINNYLNTSFLIMVEVVNFDRIAPLKTITNETDTNETINNQEILVAFNQVKTVCAGSGYVFQCYPSLLITNISTRFDNSPGHAILDAQSGNLNWTHPNVTGKYICLQSRTSDNMMILHVVDCSMWRFLRNMIILLFVSVMSLVIIALSLLCACVCRRYRRKMIVYSISKLKLEGVHLNERYVSLLSDPNWEIARSSVFVSSTMLGTGQYGQVFRGRLGVTGVAVKVARAEGVRMLIQEIDVLKQLGYHPHIIRLLGVCSIRGPLMAILELAWEGDLKSHLLAHNPSLNPSCEQIGLERLLTFVTQIANGMQYLAFKNVIHRDLAARNCLLTNDLSIKLSDFGMTRIALIYHLDDSRDLGAIAWMAPEAVTANTFTTKSDVWSFGIVMWEVFELGGEPYNLMSSSQTIDAIRRGIVNRQPTLASDAVYAIMVKCWAVEPADRPSFSELNKWLKEVDVNEYL